MHVHRIKVAVPENKTVTLVDLPFATGQSVEITVVPLQPQRADEQRYPLRGTPVQYESPTSPVAESDWEATA